MSPDGTTVGASATRGGIGGGGALRGTESTDKAPERALFSRAGMSDSEGIGGLEGELARGVEIGVRLPPPRMRSATVGIDGEATGGSLAGRTVIASGGSLAGRTVIVEGGTLATRELAGMELGPRDTDGTGGTLGGRSAE